MESIKVNFYSKDDCPLCDQGLDVIKSLAEHFPLEVEIIDIYKNDNLLEKYQIMIPVVEIAGQDVDYGILSESKIRDFIDDTFCR